MEFNGQVLELIGEGSRRACYRLVGTGNCVKFYHPPERCVAPQMRPAVVREIRRVRFDRQKNVCAQEFDMWTRIVAGLPPEVRVLLPETMELVHHPEWGWGTVQPFLTNPDGTGILSAELEMWHRYNDRAFVREMYRRIRDTFQRVIQSELPLYEASNFFTQWQADGTFALKIIDFEPSSKTLVPIERFCPWYRRWTMRRKGRKYLAYLRMAFRMTADML